MVNDNQVKVKNMNKKLIYIIIADILVLCVWIELILMNINNNNLTHPIIVMN